MRTFRQYLKEQEDEPGLGDLGSDNPEDILLRLANHVIRSHKEDFVSLLENLSDRDDRLKEDLRAYRQAERNGGRASRHMPNKRSFKPDLDQIAPNAADQGGAGTAS